MATETSTGTTTDTSDGIWKGGAVGGLLGGIAMGGMMTMMMRPVIEMAIPAMYTIEGPSLAAGWAFHLWHSLVLGVVFAGVVAARPDLVESTGKSLAAGIGYGIVVWAVLAVVVMPIWLGAVGFPPAPSVPNINMQSLIGHIVYGGVLGAVFPFLRDL